MSLVLIWAYIIINVVIAWKHYKHNYGVFEMPFLYAMVAIIFVVPGLFRIYSYYGAMSDSVMVLPLIMFILCHIAFYIGFKKSSTKLVNKPAWEDFDISKGKYIVLIFAIVGLYATLRNKGAYEGGFVEGIYVIISFFASYLDVAMVVVLVCLYKRYKVPFYFNIILIVALFLQIEQFLSIARRAQAMQTVLSVGLFYYLSRGDSYYKKYRWVIPSIFLIGFTLNSQVSNYRNNAYSKEYSIIENLQTLNFKPGTTNEPIDLWGDEIHNAMVGINSISDMGKYDFGAFNWNGIIQNYVPKVLFGSSFKQSLMFDLPSSSISNTLISTGSTMTGYYDAYSSFGLFGWIKFLLLGYFAGFLWRNREHSISSIILYVSLISPILECITHGTHYGVSRIIFYYFFIYPFIRIAIKKRY